MFKNEENDPKVIASYDTLAIVAGKVVTQTWDHENKWRKNNSGATYRQALQNKTGKPRFRDLQKRGWTVGFFKPSKESTKHATVQKKTPEKG